MAGPAQRGPKNWLEHPLTRGLHLDDRAQHVYDARCFNKSPSCAGVYLQWYRALAASVPTTGLCLRLGSGAGFLDQAIPGLITSDLCPAADVRSCANTQQLPLVDGALRAAVMVNVLHQMPNVRFVPGRNCPLHQARRRVGNG